MAANRLLLCVCECVYACVHVGVCVSMSARVRDCVSSPVTCFYLDSAPLKTLSPQLGYTNF